MNNSERKLFISSVFVDNWKYMLCKVQANIETKIEYLQWIRLLSWSMAVFTRLYRDWYLFWFANVVSSIQLGWTHTAPHRSGSKVKHWGHAVLSLKRPHCTGWVSLIIHSYSVLLTCTTLILTVPWRDTSQTNRCFLHLTVLYIFQGYESFIRAQALDFEAPSLA
jgi:hypothetical protein